MRLRVERTVRLRPAPATTPRAARVAITLRTVVRLTPSVEESALSDGSGSPSPRFEINSTAALKARLNTVSVFIEGAKTACS
jgi:hypothetical protein